LQDHLARHEATVLERGRVEVDESQRLTETGRVQFKRPISAVLS